MNTSRRTFTLAAAVIVFARTIRRAGAAPPTALAAPVGRSGNPTERTRQLAQAVLVASGNDVRLEALNESLGRSLLAALKKALPNANPDALPIMDQVVREDLKVWNARMTAANIEIYATKFTDAQLLDMLMFYRSEGGQALVAQTPAIIREKGDLGGTLTTERMPIMIKKICAKTDCSSPALQSAAQ